MEEFLSNMSYGKESKCDSKSRCHKKKINKSNINYLKMIKKIFHVLNKYRKQMTKSRRNLQYI